MAVESDMTFRRQLVSLNPHERTALLAAVFRAEGQDVTVDGARIVVSDDRTTRTIAVAGTDAAATADTVALPAVPAGPIRAALADWVRTGRTRPADEDVLTAADLRQRLLYAVDREDATDIVRTHLGCAFRCSGTGDLADQSRTPAVVAAMAAVVLLASLFGGIGLVVPDLGPGPSDPLSDSGGLNSDAAAAGATPNLTGVESGSGVDERRQMAGTGSRPDGTATSVSPFDRDRSSVDPSQLADSHRRAVTNQSVTARIDYEGPRSDLPLLDGRNSSAVAGVAAHDRISVRARADASSYFVAETYDTERGRNVTVRQYGTDDGGVTWKVSRGSETTVFDSQDPTGPSSTLAELGAPLLETYLGTDNVTIERTYQHLEYRRNIKFVSSEPNVRRWVVTTPTPPEDFDGSPETYEAVAIVRSDGIVEDLEVLYGDGTDAVRIDVDVAVSAKPLEAPAWAADTENRR